MPHAHGLTDTASESFLPFDLDAAFASAVVLLLVSPKTAQTCTEV